MAIFDTLTFPEIDGITGAPTIDGWTADVDPGVRTNKAESGYAVGGRLTYSGGAGFPPVAIGATRVDIPAGSPLGCDPGSYLALSFFCTFDFSFDNADAVTIGLLPTAPPYSAATPPYTDQRRIDIYPIHNINGAGGIGGTVQTLPGTDGFPYDARFGENERDFGVWAGIEPTADPNNPNAPRDRWVSMAVNRKNFVVRTASWKPKTSTTSTTQSAPVSAGTATDVVVVDASRFPPAAEFDVQIPGQPGLTTVAYTGRDPAVNPKRLTGCKVVAGSGGTIPSGTTISLLDVGWSLEVLIPTTNALGSEPGAPPWPDLKGDFGLYIDLIRFSKTAPAGTPPFGYFASQYRFPLLEAVANQPYVKSLDEKTEIEPSWFGTGLIPALGASNKARGVQFQAPEDAAIGVRHPGSAALTRQILKSTDNSLVALLQNSGPAAADVTAEFRFARWGAPPAEFGEWDPASLHNADPTTKITLADGTTTPTTGEVTSLWRGADVPQGYVDSNTGHHCMWVALTANAGVAFVKAGTRANFEFSNMSDVDRDATISGKGYPAPAGGGRHGFLLMPHLRTILTGSEGDDDDDDGGDGEITALSMVKGENGGPRQAWLWVVEAFRRTGQEVTIAGTTAEIVDPAPGQFSVIATHDAQNDVFSYSLSGDGVRRRGRAYEVAVPHNGETVVKVKLRAAPESEPLPDPEPPKPVPWWLRFIRWLIRLIRKLFGK